jgi:uncharacterized membrane protein
MSPPGVTVRRLASGTAARLIGIGLLGVAVAGVLAVVGRRHSPDYSLGLFGQAGVSSLALKSLLGTVALGLMVVQVVLALWLYRKLPALGSAPRPVRRGHRIGGLVLFALTVPIAVHCLLAYGVQLTSPRVAVHSVAGCLFYGAFTAKMVIVRSRRLPGWTLPVAGAGLAALFALLWSTSAAWYYATAL